MRYFDLLQRLFQLNLFGGVKLGLRNVEHLRHTLHYPDRTFSSIHVAGTNGKGSVATKIAAAFEVAGYRTALYTSPHLSSFRERIQINRCIIPEECVESLLSRLFALIDQERIPATFFEVTTLLAFLYFAQEQADIAVLETGLGGRLDATNVISPILSVITSISLDHTEILGATKEAIALEKAGIIKEHTPILIGPRVPLAPIQEEAHLKHSPLLRADCASSLFEEENRAVAYAALTLLAPRFGLSPTAVQVGVEATPPCRFQVLPGTPLVILDVAHNPDGLHHLFQTIAHHYKDSSLRVLCGLSKSKDIASCLEILCRHALFFHLVEATNGRGVPARELLVSLEKMGVTASRLFLHDSITEGVKKAREAALQADDILVICGSFFIMAEARQALGFDEPRDLIDLNERALTQIHLASPPKR